MEAYHTIIGSQGWKRIQEVSSLNFSKQGELQGQNRLWRVSSCLENLRGWRPHNLSATYSSASLPLWWKNFSLYPDRTVCYFSLWWLFLILLSCATEEAGSVFLRNFLYMLEGIIWFMFNAQPFTLCLSGYVPPVEERVKVSELNLSAASSVNFLLAGI